MNFVEVMTAAQAGFDTWAAKPHNKKWAKMVYHTPIPNDLLVNIAEAFCRASPAPLPTGNVGEAGREAAWLIERNNGEQPWTWYAERPNGWHWWTPTAHEAKQFASKADAEAFPAYQMIATDPAISVTEHVFLARTSPVAEALKNLAHEMRFLLRQNPKKDGGLYRQRLDEADAAIARAEGRS